MTRILLFGSLVTMAVCVCLLSPSAQAGDQPTWSNVNSGYPPHYTKNWRKRTKARHRHKRRGRYTRQRRESLDYLVTFPHTRVDMGTNF